MQIEATVPATEATMDDDQIQSMLDQEVELQLRELGLRQAQKSGLNEYYGQLSRKVLPLRVSFPVDKRATRPTVLQPAGDFLHRSAGQRRGVLHP